MHVINALDAFFVKLSSGIVVTTHTPTYMI